MAIKIQLPKYHIGQAVYLNFSCGSRVLVYILEIERTSDSYSYHVDMQNYNRMENVWLNEKLFSMKINRSWFDKQLKQ